jgi:high-affinity Fe2+/Pb2+ permease
MKDNLENKFKELENQFDIEVPEIGHFERFESKLNQSKSHKKHKIFKLVTSITVAASIILAVGIWIGNFNSQKGMQLANVSSEMLETQNYFVSVIDKELSTIETERNETTEKIINDGLYQLKKLEEQYTALTLELKENTGDKRIIYAMISNFQQRIDVLQGLLLQIEEVKQLKNQNNENFI